jgi:hypothetical protein
VRKMREIERERIERETDNERESVRGREIDR